MTHPATPTRVEELDESKFRNWRRMTINCTRHWNSNYTVCHLYKFNVTHHQLWLHVFDTFITNLLMDACHYMLVKGNLQLLTVASKMQFARHIQINKLIDMMSITCMSIHQQLSKNTVVPRLVTFPTDFSQVQHDNCNCSGTFAFPWEKVFLLSNMRGSSLTTLACHHCSYKTVSIATEPRPIEFVNPGQTSIILLVP